MKIIPSLVLAVALVIGSTGCSTLIPKSVEFFSKKVPSYPVQSASGVEKQRQAAALAELRTKQTLDAALTLKAPDAITVPASDAAVLSKSVAESLGPPKYPVKDTPAPKVAAKLDHSMASYNAELADYSKDIDKYAGKKIEGTGLISVPYFLWLGGVVVLCLLGYIGIKMAWAALKAYGNTNPLVAVGTSGISLVASELSKGFQQIVAGGEAFKNAVEARFGAGSDTSKQVLALFQQAHVTAQDNNVQTVVKKLTE